MESSRSNSREGQSSPLTIKSPLEFDLRDSQGNVIFAAGTHLTDQQIEAILRRGVLGNSTSSPASQSENNDGATNLLAPYDPVSVQRIQANFREASMVVDSTVQAISNNHFPDIGPLADLFSGFLSEIQKDLGTVLSTVRQTREELTPDEQLAKRSVRMAVLGVTLANALQHDAEDCQTVALSGLFHDLSLFETLSESFRQRISRRGNPTEWIRRHPLDSAELIFGVDGFSRASQTIITQVHEQYDGSGFPLGLVSSQQHPLSAILNLADAYLSLTDCSEEGLSIVEADAMAYLMHHTKEGRFDPRCMGQLIKCFSVYPIGSYVQLDNDSIAIVHRSNHDDPMNPVVRIDQEETEIIDLRKSTMKIRQPWIHQKGSDRQRLAIDRYSQILWRPQSIEP